MILSDQVELKIAALRELVTEIDPQPYESEEVADSDIGLMFDYFYEHKHTELIERFVLESASYLADLIIVGEIVLLRLLDENR